MEAVNLLSSNRYTEKQIVSGAGAGLHGVQGALRAAVMLWERRSSQGRVFRSAAHFFTTSTFREGPVGFRPREICLRASSAPSTLLALFTNQFARVPCTTLFLKWAPTHMVSEPKLQVGGLALPPDRHTFMEGPGTALKPSHLRLCGFSPGPLGVTLFLYVFSSVTQ